MKSYIVILLLIINAGIAKAGTFTFTVSAEVEKSSVVNLSKDKVRTYITDLTIYPRFFPEIVSVKNLNDSVSEWLYRVDAPLASPYNLTFILIEKNTSQDTMILESKDPGPDYLLCKAYFNPIADNRTSVTISFKISMSRESASDIHFLAGLFGEKFISDRMQEKLEDDLEIFIARASKDMYKKFK